MTIKISKITPVSEGETLLLDILISSGGNEQKLSGEIATRFFTDMGFPVFSDEEISLDREKYEELERAITLTAAIKKGIDLLSFADNTKKSLITKLTARKFSREISSEAADYLAEVGYIDEFSQAEALTEELAKKKLFGKSRIKNELYKKGFCSEAISAALEAEIDYDALCAERIKRTVGAEAFSDRESRGKAIAALMRYGFSTDNIRAALTYFSL